MNTVAICSLLHEGLLVNSATRLFRRMPVLSWTLRRLGFCTTPLALAILCWEDQLPAVAPIAEDAGATVLAKGPRKTIASIESVRIARRWADGWRGGLLGTCDFDLGFHGDWLLEILDDIDTDAALLIDPSSGLVDAKIVSALVERLEENETLEIAFAQAPPGLGGVALRRELLKRLAANHCHPGRTLHYQPDQPMHDPIGSESCVPLPTSVARCVHSFRLDSRRQIERITAAAVELNGHLLSSDAEDVINRLNWADPRDEAPREMTIELCVERPTAPIFSPAKLLFNRSTLTLDAARKALSSLGNVDDLRLTLGGVGDPLQSPHVFDVIETATSIGASVHVETDLLPADRAVIDRLAASGVDIISVYLPAITPATYAAVMGDDRLGEVIENLRRLFEKCSVTRRGGPLIVPIFVKTPQNLGEMEAWYDHWLRTLGAAVVRGPSDFAGKIPPVEVADMTPTIRRPCRRLGTRLTVLSDGQIVPCEQDILGEQPLGSVETVGVSEAWSGGLATLRAAHRRCDVSELPVCKHCREWHRP